MIFDKEVPVSNLI